MHINKGWALRDVHTNDTHFRLLTFLIAPFIPLRNETPWIFDLTNKIFLANKVPRSTLLHRFFALSIWTLCHRSTVKLAFLSNMNHIHCDTVAASNWSLISGKKFQLSHVFLPVKIPGIKVACQSPYNPIKCRIPHFIHCFDVELNSSMAYTNSTLKYAWPQWGFYVPLFQIPIDIMENSPNWRINKFHLCKMFISSISGIPNNHFKCQNSMHCHISTP